MNRFLFNHKKLSLKSTLFISFCFFIISLIGIYFHEIWLDESHHFLLGRDSNSLVDLYNNTRYDGHPILWNYLIHLVTRLSTNPFYMQLLHIIISVLIVLIFLKNAPFKLWFKIAFLCSYFMLYEYTVISRNYNLGLLFLFLACSFYGKRKEYFTTFCFFLALCCNTHSIFTIVSATFLFSVFLEQIFEFKKEHILKYWKGYLIFILGIGVSYLQIIPKGDTIFFDRIDYSNMYETAKSTMSLFKALFPIVDFTTINYWNHYFLIEYFRKTSFLLGILVWFLPLLLFNKNKYVLLFIYTTLIAFVAFIIVTQIHGTRYNGLLFISLIVGLWMLYSQKEKPFIRKNLSKFNLKIVVFLMSIQVFAGILAYSLDIKNTFNNGKNVATYIEKQKLNLDAIVTNCESASINAFLKENLYNLCYQKKQGYFLFNKHCINIQNSSDEDLIQLLFSKKTNNGLLFLINEKPLIIKNPLELNHKIYSFSLIKKFDNAVKQSYYIYKINCNEK